MSLRLVLLSLILYVSFSGCRDSSVSTDGPWVGMHFLDYNTDTDLDKLAAKMDTLAEVGVNVCILEVDYHFSYKSHPELIQDPPAISYEGAGRFSEACRKAGIRLYVQFQCLGHQSWAEKTFPLLTRYPELDLTPGAFPGNKGLYCREWDPMNPRVNQFVFALIDELIEAFRPAGIHVGMDEVFLLGSEHSPSTKGMNPAVLFAKVVNELHQHIVTGKKLEMMMWGDRLIDASKYAYGDWEASFYGTAPAVDSIPTDIIICDWHYEPRTSYPSIPMFLGKGFRVLPTSWKNVAASDSLLTDALSYENPALLGILFTAWSQYPDPANWPPLQSAISILRK